MFKTILRTLSALSIVTITASAGFAQDDPPAVDCEIIANANNSACNVTREVWKNSFKIKGTPLPLSFTGTSNQFIATDLPEQRYGSYERIKIRFETYDGSHPAYAGTAGTAGFRRHTINGVYGYSAAILDPINLGAPLSDFAPSALWSGKIKGLTSNGTNVGYNIGAKFDLLVNFTHGLGNKRGSISATIRDSLGSSEYNYDIHGSFNNRGVITGTINVREIASSDSTSGILSGIIGEKGALGVFYSTGSGGFAYAGGFRAVGPLESEWDLLKACAATPFAAHCVNDARLLVRRCNQDHNRAECTGESFVTSRCNDDPFRAECTDESFNVPKSKRIAFCIEGSNARSEDPHKCENAIKEHNCIRDPFQDDCQRTFAEYYVSARANRKILCDANMFDSLCGSKYSSARMDFCADANNESNPKCNHLLSNPTAARLSQSFDFKDLNTENRTNQFLQGTEAELTASKDGLTIEQPTDESSHEGSLNLAVLGRDASNGVSFFKGNNGTSVFHYAGIFSSTDLGEPLTSTQPNAYWKGKFQVTGYLPSTDFTLEINFGDTGGAGNTDDGRVGRIQAFVRVRADSTQHFYVDGGFTDKGVITGDVTYGFFTNSNRKRPSSRKIKGEVRGLIGEKGAVAAFISNDAGHLGYAGGFVARQTTQTEKTGLDRICAFNPFNDKCEFGFESVRDAEIARCRANREQEIADGYCDDIVQPIITNCEANPFAPKCVVLNSFKAKRADMVNRCADPDNENDRAGCSNVKAIIADCNLNPFGVYCDVSEFEQKRTDFPTDCIANGNCDTVQRTPNAATWHSTANPLTGVNAANADGGFVLGTEDNLVGVDDWDATDADNVKKLNLSTATFGGTNKPLGGEAADGLAFGYQSTDSGNKHYAGIFSGTDLGAPVAQKVGRASWVGSVSFSRGSSSNTRDFVLDVNFADRKIEADTDVFKIAGDFDDNGVIVNGTVRDALISRNGTLSGLIGEEGAVGVFINADNKFSGGFVARPPNSDQMASLNATCASFANDSLRIHNSVYLANCSLEAAAEKDSLIKKCITGANVKTDECNDTALVAADVKAAVIACIKNPFGTECDMTLGDNYDVALGNRSKFCNNFLNAEHEFCKGDNRDLICRYNHDPFNAICVGDIYHSGREQRCADENERDSVRCKPTVARICVDNSDIFNRVCGDDYNDPRRDICLGEYDNGPSARCTATVTRICINDLFHDLCKHDAYFNNRVLACRDNPLDSRCTYTITTACQRNLFDSFCDETHSDARKTRIDLCNDLTGDVPKPNCMGDNLTNLCRYDPFNAVCPSANNNARAVELLGMCANSTQADNPACISILKRPNAATLLKALPAETLVTTGQSNQFLNATKTTDSTKSGLDGLQAAVNPQTFRLTSGDARSLNLGVLGKDADDGVGYATVRYHGQSKFRHFAGIFSSTDLGAPLTQTNTKVGWKGKIQVAGYSLRSDDFTLEITFGNAGERGKVEAFVYETSNERYFHLKGDFDSKGLITGTATFGNFANHDRNGTITADEINGTLRGLIGQDGAVGAFVSNGLSGKNFEFSGGFVARALTAGENDTCKVKNPFDKMCNFGFDAERDARLVLCQEDGRATEAGCTGGANAIITDCRANPFGRDCTWDAFEDVRVTFINRCYADATGTGCAAGANAIITDCNANAFGPNCYFNVFKAKRQALLQDCKNNTSDCTPSIKASILTQVNAVTWEHVVTTRTENPIVLSDLPDTVNPRSQFLRGTEDGINNGDVEIKIYSTGLSTSGSLNFNTATFDGVALGRDASGGLAYFDSGSYPNTKSYVGILSSTDLGAPLTETSGTAKWYGQFKNSGGLKGELTLDITFNAEGTGTLEAFFHHYNENYLRLKGKFDGNGVISGTVDSGYFRNHDKIATRIYATSGLTGLIGAEGAVGVFAGDEFTSGGFIAVPGENFSFDPNVKFSDWIRNFDNPLYPTVPRDNHQQTRFAPLIETRETRNQFLTLADVRVDGEVADGVGYRTGTYYRDYPSTVRHDYAGILSGTNLGAPLDASVEAIWKGKLGMVVNAVEIEPREFTLNINFANEKISYSDAVNGAHFVALSANWATAGDNAGALINGTVTYNPGSALNDETNIAGSLTGLIGQDGAVGVFRSNGTVDTPYAGGFVAVPGTVFSRIVEYSDWVSSFDNTSPIYGAGPFNDPQQAGFVQSTGTGLDTSSLTDAAPQILTLANVNTDGKVVDGVAYTSGILGHLDFDTGAYEDMTHHYVGILSGTNLGGVLNTPVTATWKGKLGMVVNAVQVAPRDITLNINFTNIRRGITIAYTEEHLTHFVNFNNISSDDNGLITGEMTYNSGAVSNPATNSVGKVTGLIGTKGAVGAFISNHGVNHTNKNTPYAGGFVAVPSDVYVQTVSFADWVNSFANTSPLRDPLAYYSPQKTQFLQGRETGLDTRNISTTAPPNSLTLADVNAGGQVADGVGYASGTRGYNFNKTTHHVAGILSGTNLGALLDAPVTAKWRGKLGMIVDTVEVPLRDITLNINFTNTVRNITIADTKTTADTHFVSFNNLSSDENGVITGAMTYNPGSALNPATNSAGIVTGLIGQQGAVGAFISNHDNPFSKASYAGGFVARPAQ